MKADNVFKEKFCKKLKIQFIILDAPIHTHAHVCTRRAFSRFVFLITFWQYATLLVLLNLIIYFPRSHN